MGASAIAGCTCTCQATQTDYEKNSIPNITCARKFQAGKTQAHLNACRKVQKGRASCLQAHSCAGPKKALPNSTAAKTISMHTRRAKHRRNDGTLRHCSLKCMFTLLWQWKMKEVCVSRIPTPQQVGLSTAGCRAPSHTIKMHFCQAEESCAPCSPPPYHDGMPAHLYTSPGHRGAILFLPPFLTGMCWHFCHLACPETGPSWGPCAPVSWRGRSAAGATLQREGSGASLCSAGHLPPFEMRCAVHRPCRADTHACAGAIRTCCASLSNLASGAL